MRPDELTDAELQGVARRALRAYFDTADGIPDGRWSGRPLRTFSAARPIAPDDRASRASVGPVVCFRHSAKRLYVAAAIDEGANAGCGLVAAELAATRESWRVARVMYVGQGQSRADEGTRWVLQPAMPPQLQRRLGRPPANENARARWALAAAVVTGYRENWGIKDPYSALGPAAPNNAEQRHDRACALALLRQLDMALGDSHSALATGRAIRQVPRHGRDLLSI